MGSSPVTTSKSVGRLLRRRREALGLSLRRVSRDSAARGETIPASTLSRIEHGRLDPGVRRLTTLLRLYDLDPAHIADLAELESMAVEPPQGDVETIAARALSWLHAGNLHQALAHVFALREYAADDPEQREVRQRASLNLAILARSLGKDRLARKLVDDLLCEPLPERLLTSALIVSASLWTGAGGSEVALALIARAATRVGPGDPLQRARVRHQEAKILLHAGKAEEASAALDAAMADYRAADHTHDEMAGRILRIAILEATGIGGDPIPWARETIAACERAGHPRLAAHARIELGRLLQAAGRSDEAEDELRRAVAECERVGDPGGLQEARDRMAAIEAEEV